MREIKFRVWDIENKVMVLPDRDGYEYEEGPFIGLDGKLYQQEDNSYGCDCCIYIKLLTYDYKLLQYTGLKDKNGKEIYEGDIVKDRFDTIGQVVIGNYRHGEYHHKGVHLLFKDGETSPLPASIHSEEVIGNIYENPELIKEN